MSSATCRNEVLVFLLLLLCFSLNGAVPVSVPQAVANGSLESSRHFTVGSELHSSQDGVNQTQPYKLGWLPEEIPENTRVTPLMALALPSHLDWRDYGGNWMTTVKNQASCGSCVAFAAVATTEANFKIAYNNSSWNLDLSEQHLFSCGGGSCATGWWISSALNRLRDYGTPDEACSPYQSGDGVNRPCPTKCVDNTAWQPRAYKINSWYWVAANAGAIQAELMNGPLVAAFAVYTDFFHYSGGVYHHTWGVYEGGHAVTIVGYDQAGQYWIVKNSWGSGWGEGGYFKIGFGEPVGDPFTIESAVASVGVDNGRTKVVRVYSLPMSYLGRDPEVVKSSDVDASIRVDYVYQGKSQSKTSSTFFDVTADVDTAMTLSIASAPSGYTFGNKWEHYGNSQHDGSELTVRVVSGSGFDKLTAFFRPSLAVVSMNPLNVASVASPVELKVRVTYHAAAVSGATVHFCVNSLEVGSSTSLATGYASYFYQAPSLASYSWYATAEKSGYALGTSPTRTFTVSAIYAGAIAGVTVVPDAAHVGQGSRVTFTVTATNTGPSDIAYATVKVKIYKPGPVLAATLTKPISAFMAGSSRSVDVVYMLPVTAPTGTWTYDVYLYRLTTLLDDDTGRTFTVEAPVKTGTIVSVVDAPDPVLHGHTATFTVTFKNTGNIVWSYARVTVKIYKPNGLLAAQRMLTVMNVVPSVDYARDLTWLVPTTYPTGLYTYNVYLSYLTTQVDKFEPADTTKVT